MRKTSPNRAMGKSAKSGRRELRQSASWLVINLKAKALDLEVPPTLLARADEVIERTAQMQSGHQRHEWHGRAAPIWPTWLRLPEREDYIEVQWRNPNARKWQTICATSIFVVP